MCSARMESSNAVSRRVDIGRFVSAPITAASGTRDLYRTRPRSSFTSITRAFISVRPATSINFQILLPIAAQRFTYRPRNVSGRATTRTHFAQRHTLTAKLHQSPHSSLAGIFLKRVCFRFEFVDLALYCFTHSGHIGAVHVVDRRSKLFDPDVQ